jgi:hypothetical protein
MLDNVPRSRRRLRARRVNDGNLPGVSPQDEFVTPSSFDTHDGIPCPFLSQDRGNSSSQPSLGIMDRHESLQRARMSGKFQAKSLSVNYLTGSDLQKSEAFSVDWKSNADITLTLAAFKIPEIKFWIVGASAPIRGK